jgi:hypothetical protein
MHLWWVWTNRDTPLFRGNACFNLWTTSRRQQRCMISYSQVWRSFPFHVRNCCVTMYICRIEKTFCISICICNNVHVIVCPRSNIKHTCSEHRTTRLLELDFQMVNLAWTFINLKQYLWNKTVWTSFTGSIFIWCLKTGTFNNWTWLVWRVHCVQLICVQLIWYLKFW